eukprot:gene14169-15648_t
MTSTARKYANFCLKCNIFNVPVFKREDLLLLSIKDLRVFLLSKNISTQHCKERYDLVDLIMNFAEENGRKSLTDIRMEEKQRERVENLRKAAQKREEEEVIRSHQEEVIRSHQEEVIRSHQEEVIRSHQEEVPGSHQNSQSSSDHIQEEIEQNLPGTPLHVPTVKHNWKSIEDISSLDDVDSLSVVQLKKILTVNFIDYRGCFEKQELIDRVKTLWNSKHRTSTAAAKKKDDEDYDEELCKICMDHSIDCVLLECGHLVTCTKCGRQLADCPVCRRLVSRVVHVFKA